MPLSKSYYEHFGSKTSKPRSANKLFEHYSRKPEEIKEDSHALLDFLGSSFWGASSGLTWGASEFTDLGLDKSWEEMSGAERSGWVLGEGLSLMMPFVGPFALMGRGAKAVTKLAGNKFVKKAGKTVMENMPGKTAKSALKLKESGIAISDDVQKGLNTAAKSDMGVRWMNQLRQGTDEALDAAEGLTRSGAFAIKKAFEDAGVKKIADGDALLLAEKWVNELKKGRYANDVAEWVEHSMGGVASGKVRDFMSKYLGMATQDMLMMTTHGMISGKLSSLANNEDFDTMSTLSHSGVMALGFPLIRRIPFGGQSSLQQGMKAYMGKYFKTNYAKITNEHGEEVTKNLLRVLVRGSKKDLINRSKFGDAGFKIGNTTYKGKEDILSKLDDKTMPMEHVYGLLNKFKQVTNKEILKKWNSTYWMKDLAASTLRMTAGVSIMNTWMFDKDAWGSMESSELASHLFISALMTKGRGAWGRTEQRAYMADFTKEYEVLNILGVKPNKVKDLINTYEASDAISGFGATFSSHEIGQKIVEIVDRNKTDEKSAVGRNYSNPEHAIVHEMLNIYNLIRKSADPNATVIKSHQLSEKSLNNIAKELGELKFGDGVSVKELGFNGTTVRLTEETTSRGIGLFKSLAEELGQFGYDITVDANGKITAGEIGSLVDGKDLSGDNVTGAGTVNRLIRQLVEINEADPIRQKLTIEELAKKNNMTEEQVQRETQNIIDKHMERIGVEYDDKRILRDPVEDNPLWEVFSHGKDVQANERMYKIMMGKAEGTDKNLTDAMDTLFKLKDGKYAKSIDDYKIEDLVDDYKPKAKDEKSKKRNEEIEEAFESLRYLFELRKVEVNRKGKSKHTAKSRGKIKSSDVEVVSGAFKDIVRTLPKGWINNFYDKTLNTYITRSLAGRGVDRRAYNAFRMLMGSGWIQRIEGEFVAPDRVSVEKDMRENRVMSEKQIETVLRAFDTIDKVLGKDLVKAEEFMYTETGDKTVAEFDLGELIKTANYLQNDTINDFVVNVDRVLKKIETEDTGTRNKIQELNGKILDILDAVNPDKVANPLTEGMDAIGAVKELILELETLKKNTLNKDNLNDFEGVLTHLNRILENVDPVTKKLDTFKVGLRQKTAGIEPDDSWGIHNAIGEPIIKSLERIYQKERDGIAGINYLVNRIMELSQKGKSGLGIDRASQLRLLESLISKLNKQYKQTDTSVETSLSDLMLKIADEGFFSDSIDLFKAVDKQINNEVHMNKQHPLNAEAVKAAKSIEDGSSVDEYHRSPMDIARKYGLLNKDGRFKTDFRIAINENIETALDVFVKDKIYADPKKSKAEKDAEWFDFQNKDSVELAMNLINGAPVRSMKIGAVGVNRSVITIDPGKARIGHPNIKYYQNKGFEIIHIDETISIERDGILRNTTINSLGDPEFIHQVLNKAIRENATKFEILELFKHAGFKITNKELTKLLSTETDYLFFARLSPNDKIAFVGSKENLDRLDKDYNNWYESTHKRLKDKDQETFEQLFGHVGEQSNSRHIVEMKLMLPYLTNMGKRGLFDKWIKEIGGEARDFELSKLESKMYKTGSLSDGGTTQPFSRELLTWISNSHVNPEVRKIAKTLVKNDGFRTGLINDVAAEEALGHALNIQSIADGQLAVVGQSGDIIQHIANLQASKNGNLKSLSNSSLDGIKFASERLMKLHMAAKGRLDTDFTDSPNGAKTIIFATGDGNQMLGKGYMIYHPEIAKNMPKGVDLLIGNSAAKDFDGISANGKPVQAADIVGSSKDWFTNLNRISESSKMTIPLDGIGVSFTSKRSKGVTISNSVFDLQSPEIIRQAYVFMELQKKIGEIALEWNGIANDAGKLAKYLYTINEEQGNPLERGDYGIVKYMLEYGANPDNIFVLPALKRLLRSSNFKHLSKNSKLWSGEDNFIIPDITGELSIPVYAEIYSKGEKNARYRASIQYGGVQLPMNTALKTKLGSGARKNLNGHSFIFRDKNGVDSIIGFDKNGKIEVYSTFFDRLNHTKNAVIGSIDENGNNQLKEWGKKRDIDTENAVREILIDLNKQVIKHDLSYVDVFNLLQNGSVTKEDGLGVSRSVTLHGTHLYKDAFKKFKLNFSTLNHAVPTIGHDKVINRVEGLAQGLDGLVSMNVHDLRTVLQRDHDGDHLYTFTKMPFDMVKSFARENGMKSDFNMMGTENYLNRELINVFGVGIGKNSKLQAGVDISASGFQKYAKSQDEAKKAIGRVIGARHTLGWLDRLGFQWSKDGKNVMRNITNPHSDLVSDRFKFLDKFYDASQTSVDIHNGIHELFADQSKLMDYLFFGILPANLKTALRDNGTTKDLILDKHHESTLFGKTSEGKNFGQNSRLEREVFYEILRTMKKVNMLQNDTWDERGSRPPEPQEIRKAFYDMKNLFEDPNLYLAKKLANRISWMKKNNIQGAKALTSEMMIYFHGKDWSRASSKDREKLFKDMLKGQVDVNIKNNFKFGNFTSENVQQAFDLDIPAKVMSELVTNQAFKDFNYDGIEGVGTDAYNAAGLFVKNIESFVAHAKMLGEDPVTLIADLKENINIGSFTDRSVSGKIRQGMNNGILRDLIHKQHGLVMGQLEYLRGEPFTNHNKESKLVDRLFNLNEAMNIMDKQIAGNLVITKNSKDRQILTTKNKEGQKYKFDWLRKDQAVDVYKIKGDVKVRDKDDIASLSSFISGVNGREIDHGMLEYVGKYNNKGFIGGPKQSNSPLFLKPGWTYVVDKNPMQKVAMSSSERIYGNALQEATYGNDYYPENFLKDDIRASEFRDDVRMLRAKIGINYSKTIEEALSQKVLKERIFAFDQARTMEMITKFVERWGEEVNSDIPLDVLFRYVLQPEILPKFYADNNGIELPVFKTNMRLFKSIAEWSENNQDLAPNFLRRLTKDVEDIAAGRHKEPDASVYDRTHFERYDYSQIPPDMVNTVRSLVKDYFWIAAPELNQHFNKIIKKSKRPSINIEGPDGEKVKIRRPSIKSYEDVSKDSQGKDC